MTGRLRKVLHQATVSATPTPQAATVTLPEEQHVLLNDALTNVPTQPLDTLLKDLCEHAQRVQLTDCTCAVAFWDNKVRLLSEAAPQHSTEKTERVESHSSNWSALSPAVRDLLLVDRHDLTTRSSEVTAPTCEWLDKDGMLSFDKVHEAMLTASASPASTSSDQSANSASNSATTASASNTAADEVTTYKLRCGVVNRAAVDLHDYLLRYAPSRQYFGVSVDSLRDPPSALSTLLDCVVTLENRLAGVYCGITLQQAGTPDRPLSSVSCPRMLKDLLPSQPLLSALGHSVIDLLSVLVGPPYSLNLRNLSWHGFFNCSEFHPSYTALMLVVCESIDRMLPAESREWGRPKQSISEYEAILAPVFVQSQTLLRGVSTRDIVDIFHTCAIVESDRRPFWTAIIDMWRRGETQRAVVLLLPQLEHLLRILYVAVNGAAARFYTAESDVLYTSIDILLSPTTDQHGANRLLIELGCGLFELLLDVFYQLSGPRFRDKVSHGILPSNLDYAPWCELLIAASVVICYRNRSQSLGGEAERYAMDCCVFADQYRSLFSEKACAVRSLQSGVRAVQHLCQQLSALPDMADGDGVNESDTSTEGVSVEHIKTLDYTTADIALVNELVRVVATAATEDGLTVVKLSSATTGNVDDSASSTNGDSIDASTVSVEDALECVAQYLQQTPVASLWCTNSDLQRTGIAQRIGNLICTCEEMTTKVAQLSEIVLSGRARTQQRKVYTNVLRWAPRIVCCCATLVVSAVVMLRYRERGTTHCIDSFELCVCDRDGGGGAHSATCTTTRLYRRRQTVDIPEKTLKLFTKVEIGADKVASRCRDAMYSELVHVYDGLIPHMHQLVDTARREL